MAETPSRERHEETFLVLGGKPSRFVMDGFGAFSSKRESRGGVEFGTTMRPGRDPDGLGEDGTGRGRGGGRWSARSNPELWYVAP